MTHGHMEKVFVRILSDVSISSMSESTASLEFEAGEGRYKAHVTSEELQLLQRNVFTNLVNLFFQENVFMASYSCRVLEDLGENKRPGRLRGNEKPGLA